MKKNIFLFLVLFSCLFFKIDTVFGASAKITVTGSPKTVLVGEKVKVTITISSGDPLGAWEFDLKYDTARLKFVSSTLEGRTNSVGVTSGSNIKTKTYTATFEAIKSGSAKVSIANSEVMNYSEKYLSVTNGSYTFNVKTKAEIEASYSKNNNLKSLSVEGYELTPKFDKNTLEYSLEVENGTESVTIKASKEDSKASISGTGTKLLSEGDNKFTIRVTAENGSTKEYKIRIHVKELNPIVVTVDGEEYNVVRKTEGLSVPSTFTETTTFFGEEEAPIFESDITGYRLVALKNPEGEVGFYKMEEDGSYTPYIETSFNGITIVTLTPKEEIPEGYEAKGEVSIDSLKIPTYRSSNSNYPLIYGINIETGEENWYTYDEEERTLQRFQVQDMKEIESLEKRFFFVTMILSGCVIFLLFFLVLLFAKKRKIERKMNL